MKIIIIQIGKNKDAYVEEGSLEFLKRLKIFAKIKLVTLQEIAASKTFTRGHCVEKEGQEILKAVNTESRNDDPYVVVLDEKGREYTSVEFAGFLEKFIDSGRPIIFVIGGPYGLSDGVKQKANSLISFSKMTFTHQMIRLFLLEQIYRGVSILNGKEYHHG